MAVRLSKAKMEQLGKRLVVGDKPDADDLSLLQEILLARSQQLEEAIARVRGELNLAPTSRVKNTGTILEKLRRQGGWTLASMQDLAGMRVVGDFDRRGQDEVVGRLVRLFGDEERPPKVIDRRAKPMHGYAAVHVIVLPEGAPIEIQVRTARQHEWAELFEKLADLVGRDIRYGEPPHHWSTPEALPLRERALYDQEYRIRELTVKQALLVAELIAAVEGGEVVPLAPGPLSEFQRHADDAIVLMRGNIATLESEIR